MEREEALNPGKSVFVSAPAGSGKTQLLAERYVTLLEQNLKNKRLQEYSEKFAGRSLITENILSITFTRKAAFEMRERVFELLLGSKSEELRKIGRDLLEHPERIRISTIHSFCHSLLRRFSLEAGVDPEFNIIGGWAAESLSLEAIDAAIRNIIERDIGVRKSLQASLARLRVRKLIENISAITKKLPITDPAFARWQGERNQIYFEIFKLAVDILKKNKKEEGCLEYHDLEVETLKLLRENPEWLNILYAFNSQIQHILVDEFQDTNFYQWRIIYALIEDWVSGSGIANEMFAQPTLFLVGDEEQSIYLFRGADMQLFREASRMMEENFGRESRYVYYRPDENYRSLDAVINFANSLFQKVMSGSGEDNLKTSYIRFKKGRKDKQKGEVGILLSRSPKKIGVQQMRELDAEIMGGKIQSIVGKLLIFDKEKGETLPCQWENIAVLLRDRNSLPQIEAVFKRRNIPYVVIGSKGLFETPEVRLLYAILKFLRDPTDDLSFLSLLFSPCSYLSSKEVNLIARAPGFTLLRRFEATKLSGKEEEKRSGLLFLINNWEMLAFRSSTVEVLEKVLLDLKIWNIYSSDEEAANIKKFLWMVQVLESEGLTLWDIAGEIAQFSRRGDEEKGQIEVEGTNAVNILTIHGAKGLEFPIVFISRIHEALPDKRTGIFVDEAGEYVSVTLSEGKKEESERIKWMRQKYNLIAREEQKRLFYVAVTRARDYLYLTGIWPVEDKVKKFSWLGYLKDAFEIEFSSEGPTSKTFLPEGVYLEDGRNYMKLPIISPAKEEEVPTLDRSKPLEEPLEFVRVSPTEAVEIPPELVGEGGLELGEIVHEVLEMISKNRLTPDEVEGFLKTRSFNSWVRNEARRHLRVMRETGLLEKYVILDNRESYSELPFAMKDKGKVISGRIDRVILEEDTALIIDYKTHSQDKEEIRKIYKPQIEYYKKAVDAIFKPKSIRAYILLTGSGELIKM